MENFSVRLSGLNQRIDEEQNIINMLSSLEDKIRTIRNNLNYQIKSRGNLQSALNRLADNVDGYRSDVKNLQTALKNVHSEYEKTERRICGYKNDHPISLDDIWKMVTTIGEGAFMNALMPGLGWLWVAHEILKDEEWKRSSDFGKYGHTLWNKLDKDKKNNILKEHYELKDGKWVKTEKDDINDKDDKEKKAGQKRKELLDSITIWKGSTSKEGSLLHFGTDGDVEADWGNYSYSADVMQAEAHASVTITASGISAEMGVAVTAFTAEASAQLGSDMLGVHGDVEVDIGKAEAKAKVSAGWVDDDGHLDPNFGITASAEAIAAEISGTAGIDIGGIEADVTGSLNIGIGAHADFGYMDGKFSLDFGASLGVGGSVKLEIDVSKTVDMVVDCANNIGEVASEAWKDAQELIGNIGNAADAVADFTEGVMDGVGDALSSGWSTVKNWFSW